MASARSDVSDISASERAARDELASIEQQMPIQVFDSQPIFQPIEQRPIRPVSAQSGPAAAKKVSTKPDFQSPMQTSIARQSLSHDKVAAMEEQDAKDLEEAYHSLNLARWTSPWTSFPNAALEHAYQEHSIHLAMTNLRFLSVLAVAFSMVIGLYNLSSNTFMQDVNFFIQFTAGSWVFALLMHCLPHRMLKPIMRRRKAVLVFLSTCVMGLLLIPMYVHDQEDLGSEQFIGLHTNNGTHIDDFGDIRLYLLGSWSSCSFTFCFSLVCILAGFPPLQAFLLLAFVATLYLSYLQRMLAVSLGTDEIVVFRQLLHFVPSAFLAIVASGLYLKHQRHSFLMTALMKKAKEKHIKRLESKNSILEKIRRLHRYRSSRHNSGEGQSQPRQRKQQQQLDVDIEDQPPRSELAPKSSPILRPVAAPGPSDFSFIAPEVDHDALPSKIRRVSLTHETDSDEEEGPPVVSQAIAPALGMPPVAMQFVPAVGTPRVEDSRFSADTERRQALILERAHSGTLSGF